MTDLIASPRLSRFNTSATEAVPRSRRELHRCADDCWLRRYRGRAPLESRNVHSRSSKSAASSSSSSNRDFNLPVIIPQTRSSSLLTPTDRLEYGRIKEWQIRVLRVEPAEDTAPLVTSLEVANLTVLGAVLLSTDELISYSAISYTWGDTWNCVRIACGDFDLDVAASVSEAIHHLRQRDDAIYMWVDTICINQSDHEEKAVQVRKMAQTYAMATQVFVWLGMKDNCGGRAIDYVNDHEKCISHELECLEGLKHIRDDMKYLCAAPWFERTWIRQEVFAARALFVKSEDTTIPFDTFRKSLPQAVAELKRSLGPMSWSSQHDECIIRMGLLKRATPGSLVHILGSQDRSHLQGDREWLLECSLRGSFHFKATEPQDFVYGLVSMSSTKTLTMAEARRSAEEHEEQKSVYLPLSYDRTMREVFCDTTVYIINLHRSLDVILLSCVYRDTNKSIAERELPTWCPDWRCIHTNTYLDPIWSLIRRLQGQDVKDPDNVNPLDRILGFDQASHLLRRPELKYYSQSLWQNPLSGLSVSCRCVIIGSILQTSASQSHDDHHTSSLSWGSSKSTTVYLQSYAELIANMPGGKFKYVDVQIGVIRGKNTCLGALMKGSNLAIQDSQKGDLVALLAGCTLPVILRDTHLAGGARCYYLVGPLISFSLFATEHRRHVGNDPYAAMPLIDYVQKQYQHFKLLEIVLV